MSEAGSTGTTAGPTQVGGPAAVAGALRVLDRHTRVLVKLSIAQQTIQDVDLAHGVGDLHDRLARLLHGISLEHGTDAMSTAAEYAAAAIDAGSLYPGDELDAFLGGVALAARTTSRELMKGTPFGA